MTTPAHDIGDLRILSVVFTDAATPPVETDPTTIVLTIKEPDGVILTENFPDVRFICAGGTSSEYLTYERQVKNVATELGLDNHVLWLGPRTDPERLMAACDITTLTSDSGEGFPNSVAESMACGTPCVVTDVGDAALIVTNPDAVVRPASPVVLVNAWKSMLGRLEEDAANIASTSRNSIVERYSPDRIARKTLAEIIKRAI